MLTIGTGIGGGLIVDGRLYRGSTGAAGELGHVVIEADGPRCQGNCPNRGCVESLASGTAIAREGRVAAERAPESALGRALAGGEELDGALVTDAALEGDETAREVMALVGRRIGVALSSLANALDPDVIVIGGGAIRAGELLVDPARRELAARALPPMNRRQGRGGRARARRGDDRRRGAGGGGRLVAGRLTVCPTPIGNVEDLSPRAQRALGGGRPRRLRGHPARRAASTSGWRSPARASSPTTRATKPSGRCSSPSRSSAAPGWC